MTIKILLKIKIKREREKEREGEKISTLQNLQTSHIFNRSYCGIIKLYIRNVNLLLHVGCFHAICILPKLTASKQNTIIICKMNEVGQWYPILKPFTVCIALHHMLDYYKHTRFSLFRHAPIVNQNSNVLASAVALCVHQYKKYIKKNKRNEIEKVYDYFSEHENECKNRTDDNGRKRRRNRRKFRPIAMRNGINYNKTAEHYQSVLSFIKIKIVVFKYHYYFGFVTIHTLLPLSTATWNMKCWFDSINTRKNMCVCAPLTLAYT